MPSYAYRAYTEAGQRRDGRIDAEGTSAAEQALWLEGLKIVALNPVPPKKTMADYFPSLYQISRADIILFTRQLATFVGAGVPMSRALGTIAQETASPLFKRVILAVLDDLERGQNLSEALAKHQKVFPALYIDLVRVAELTGNLEATLTELAGYLRRDLNTARRVQAAMIYPAVIMSVAAIAIAVLLIFVIPTFQNMFASVNLELPLPTRIVIGMSNVLKNYWWAIIAVAVFLFVAISRYYKTTPGKLQIDKLLLSMPVLGDLLRKSAVSRFTRTLGTLISSGVSILDGLEITARTAGNMVIHNAVMESRASIAGGETIAGPLQKSNVFPPMVISMIAVGEQTGGLDEMLSKIADFYDDEVDAAVSALLALMEPIMIVVLGVIVGGMVVAMYLPIFDMVNAVQ